MPFLLAVLFCCSGATSLVYEVAWMRSLQLVFGGSHLAVTTVLTVFMGGLALGGALFGRMADRARSPLRMYGWLELGIGAGAGLFLLLTAFYPAIYGPLARLGEENPAWLTAVRVTLAVLAMLGPTVLMGGTLPVLVRFAATDARRLGRHVAALYAVNTLGALAGTAAAGFVLLRHFGADGTQWLAIGGNVGIGVVALLLARRRDGLAERPPAAEPVPVAAEVAPPVRAALAATAVAGFCALGYEVLWTRALSIVVGTSVYSFVVILVAFLGGIASGSAAFGLVQRRWRWQGRSALVMLGVVLIATGAVATGVTFAMRDMTSVAPELQHRLASGSSEFAARQLASLLVALCYLFAPAFLFGASFPMAAALAGGGGGAGVGRAIGSALSCNTVGAVLGAGVTGFVLAPALGYERALHGLAALLVGAGIATAAAAAPRPGLARLGLLAPVALLAAVLAAPASLRLWSDRMFAVYVNNTRDAIADPEARAALLKSFEVLYFHEGANEAISVVRRDNGTQIFIVNGRPEATTIPSDVQLQYSLGHLPMLLHRDPKSAFVLGTGAGMTLGAVAAHPQLQRLLLAEIEPSVLPATRAFGEHNHRVLDDPRLHIVLNDGRNHLATTRERFDVITADPIHPWAGGAAYLYTREYFRTLAAHLQPGGVAGQWLPLYELSVQDVKCVVRTFAEQFAHTAVFVTFSDAVLVGSDTPLDFDEARLAERMKYPVVAEDLGSVDMGTPRHLLSYFVMGDAGVKQFGLGAVVNTDDNLFLEFSAPESIGVPERMGEDLAALAACREPLLAYLPAGGDETEVARRSRLSHDLHEAGRLYDTAHVQAAWARTQGREYQDAMVKLMARHPTYAPYRFLTKL